MGWRLDLEGILIYIFACVYSYLFVYVYIGLYMTIYILDDICTYTHILNVIKYF